MLEIKTLKKEEFSKYTKRIEMNSSDVLGPVQDIINNVRLNKDKALHDYTLKFDKADIEEFKVSQEEIENSINNIDSKLKQALLDASENIKKFHKAQIPSDWTMTVKDGVTAGQIIRPLEKVGCYIPGGRAAYPSSILMTVIPAKIAGVKKIICCTPPDKEGNIRDEILAAAYIAGATDIYKVGGAQAIAAMAYSTESIPSVDKIVGPGNIFVATAKKLVYGDVDIEFPAGPSEMLALIDESANPKYIATELLSQAEHDPNAATILVSTSRKTAQECVDYCLEYLQSQERKEIIEESLSKYCHILVADNIDEAIEFTNEYAPEHLIISTSNYMQIAEKITNAGSIFLGHLTPESAGDYASGTNHTLPTNGYAKAYSGVNLDSFRKKITYQEITPSGLQLIGNAIEIMAENEQLFAHKNAVTLRMNK